MSERDTATLEEVADPATGFAIGPFGSRMKAEHYRPSGIRVLRGTNMTTDGKIVGDFVFIDQEFAETLSSARLRPGDIALPHRGAIGRSALIRSDDMVMSTSLMRVRLNPELADAQFMAAFLRSEVGRSEVLRFASTVGTPGIGQPLTSLRQVRVPRFPLADQKRIARVLGAFDDLIETNRALAVRLDGAAREAWRTLAADLDLAPVDEQANVVLGGTPARKAAEYWGGDVPWLNSGEANEFRVLAPSEWITSEGYARSSTKMMPVGSTLVAITGATLGQTTRLEIEACGNQSLVGVYPHGADLLLSAHLFLAISEDIEQLLRHATGGAQQHVNKANVEGMAIPALNETARERMLPVQQALDAVGPLLIEAAEVTRTRDELLPLLMSGRIRVAEAEEALASLTPEDREVS